MYSRYIPNANGGYERRQVPDSVRRLATQPPAPEAAHSPEPTAEPAAPIRPGGHDPPPAPPQGPRRGGPPPAMRPVPPHGGPGFRSPPPFGAPRPGGGPPNGLPGLGPLPGPDGLLGRLLPRGLDAEDLLVLAVLLLAMKQDGASGTELLLAAGLYMFL